MSPEDKARLAAAEREALAKAGWTCFHCGEHFVDREAATQHFGSSELSTTACQLDITEYRAMEEFTARCRAEDSDTDRAMRRMQAEHDVALRREEEKGYAKGLADGRQEARAKAIEECAQITATIADENMPEPYWDLARARRMDWACACSRIMSRIRALARDGKEGG